MKKLILTCAAWVLTLASIQAQTQIVTTGNNLINTTNPYGADIVIGSNAAGGIRHDSSIMWWSNASASRISNTSDVFHFSAWSTTTPNIALSAVPGGQSYFLGNVGIGSTVPSSSLTIEKEGGDADGSFLLIKNTNATFGGGATLAGIKTTGGSGGHYNFLKLQNVDGTKFLITGTGDVAIGTGDTHGHKLAVNGSIRAKEIKVEAAPWPDYVFEKDYQLTPLLDLEKYIIANKHLPEVPSGKEIEISGLALGEMNRLLIKKVEELTLHIITKEKQMLNLQADVEMLKKLIGDMKK